MPGYVWDFLAPAGSRLKTVKEYEEEREELRKRLAKYLPVEPAPRVAWLREAERQLREAQEEADARRKPILRLPRLLPTRVATSSMGALRAVEARPEPILPEPTEGMTVEWPISPMTATSELVSRLREVAPRTAEGRPALPPSIRATGPGLPDTPQYIFESFMAGATYPLGKVSRPPKDAVENVGGTIARLLGFAFSPAFAGASALGTAVASRVPQALGRLVSGAVTGAAVAGADVASRVAQGQRPEFRQVVAEIAGSAATFGALRQISPFVERQTTRGLFALLKRAGLNNEQAMRYMGYAWRPVLGAERGALLGLIQSLTGGRTSPEDIAKAVALYAAAGAGAGAVEETLIRLFQGFEMLFGDTKRASRVTEDLGYSVPLGSKRYEELVKAGWEVVRVRGQPAFLRRIEAGREDRLFVTDPETGEPIFRIARRVAPAEPRAAEPPAAPPQPEPIVAPPPVPPPQPTALKPYEGLLPGTPDWMAVRRAHPELQPEMLEYQRRLAESTARARPEGAVTPPPVTAPEEPARVEPVPAGPPASVEEIRRRAEEVQRLAATKQPILNRMMQEVVSELGLRGYQGNVKSVASMVAKVVRKDKPEYDIYSMKDHARGILILNDFSEVPKVVEALSRRGRFSGEASIDKPLNQFGYRGIHLTTQLGDGINAEIQLHTPESLEIKKATDEIYRKYRDYWRGGELHLPPELAKDFQRDILRSTNLWTSFWERISPEIKEAASSAVRGLESAIAPSVPSKSLQEPVASSKTTGQPPPSIGRRSITRPSAKSPKPYSSTEPPPEDIIAPETGEASTAPPYVPPEGARAYVYPAISPTTGRISLFDVREGIYFGGPFATWEDAKAAADRINSERAERERRLEEEKARFPILEWTPQAPGYLRTMRSRTEFARFLQEATEVGSIAQAYGHKVPVYWHKGRLVRVSEEATYGPQRTVFEVNPSDYGEHFKWRETKLAREVREKLAKSEPAAPLAEAPQPAYRPKPGERVVARDLRTGREFTGTFMRAGKRGSWVFGVLRLDDGSEKVLSLTKHVEWRPAPTEVAPTAATPAPKTTIPTLPPKISPPVRQGNSYVAFDGTRFTGKGAKENAEFYTEQKSLIGAVVKSYGGTRDLVLDVRFEPERLGWRIPTYTVKGLDDGIVRVHQTPIRPSHVIEWPSEAPKGPTLTAAQQAIREPEAEAPRETEVRPARPPFAPAGLGKTATAKTERGTSVQLQYAVADARSLVSSHDAELQPDPRYPHELQPRDRTRIASEAQINRIANTLEPEWLAESPKASEGAPIVGSDGIVESGNARTIALKRLYKRGHKNAELYRNWLLENADRFGLKREDIERVEQPVLVRIRRSEVDRIQFVHEANEQAVAAMSATEQALADAKKLTGAIMSYFEPDETGAIATARNADFIRAFMTNVVSPAERARYLTAEGKLSQEGIQRIRNAVFAKAYGDPTVIAKLAEDPESRIRNITNAMLIAAPSIADLKEGITQGNYYDIDITPELGRAVSKLSGLREAGQSVEEYLRQRHFFEELGPLEKEILGALDKHSRSAKKLAAILTRYAEMVKALGSPRQVRLFGFKPPTKAEILEAAIKGVEEGGAVYDGEAVGRPVAHKQPPAVEAAAGGPEERPGRHTDQLQEELGKRVEEVIEEEKPLSEKLRFIPYRWPKDEGAAFRFEDDALEARYRQAHGLGQEAFWPKLRLALQSAYNKLSREFEHLPRTEEFAPLRFELLRLQKQKGIAADKAIRIEQGIVAKMLKRPDLFNLFERKVLLDDLAEEAKLGHELPLGFTKESVERELARLDKAIENAPEVKEALAVRKKAWDAIKRDYVEAMKEIGFDVEDRFTRENYFRHQVLEYARAYSPAGVGQKLRTPTGRGFLRQRAGTAKDINTAYLQAEFEVMAQMLYDIEVARVIDLVNRRYNIQPQLVEKAASHNASKLAELAEKDKEVDAALKGFRQRIAIAMGRLRKLAAQGKLPAGEKGEFADVVEDLEEEEMQVAEALEADLTSAEIFGPSVPGMPLTPEARRFFEYLSWLYPQDVEGAKEAAMIFKAISERRQFIRQALGKDFKTWEDFIPEGYTTWQPREGNVFYFADSLPSHLAQKLAAGTLEEVGVTADDLRKVLAVGFKRPQYVVKEEVAKALDNFGRVRPADPVSAVAESLMRGWKMWQLLSPKRVLRYNLRNLSGDAEGVFVGNPSAFRKVPQAIQDLYDTFFHDGPMSENLRDWFERGGMQSVLQVQEIGDVDKLRAFRDLARARKVTISNLPSRIWEAYWRAARLGTDFREAVLRYAAYLDYLEQMKADPNGRPRNFGASDPKEIMALDDIRDRAFWLSNDLLGAYDRVSVAGQWLRKYLMPFWSWQEVNARRYLRFIRNAAADPRVSASVGKAFAKRLGILARMTPFLLMRLGSLVLKMVALTALLHVYNNSRWPEEEAELPEDVREKPHIVLGRDKEGKVLYFDRLGALDDFLGFFLLDWVPDAVADVLNGKKTLAQVAREAPENIGESWRRNYPGRLGPHIQTLVELVTGRRLNWATGRTAPIRDPVEELADKLGLADEYRKLAGKPSRPYTETWQSIIASRVDPKQAAYFDILDEKQRFMRKLGKAGEYGGTISPRSNALYNLRMAVRYEDQKAFERALMDYVRWGGTAQGLLTSIRNLDPLHGLNEAEKIVFIERLDEEGKRKLALAYDHYDEMLADFAKMLNMTAEELKKAS